MSTTKMRRLPKWGAGDVLLGVVIVAWMVAYVWVTDLLRRGGMP